MKKYFNQSKTLSVYFVYFLISLFSRVHVECQQGVFFTIVLLEPGVNHPILLTKVSICAYQLFTSIICHHQSKFSLHFLIKCFYNLEYYMHTNPLSHQQCSYSITRFCPSACLHNQAYVEFLFEYSIMKLSSILKCINKQG